jgi:hypothetical protein
MARTCTRGNKRCGRTCIPDHKPCHTCPTDDPIVCVKGQPCGNSCINKCKKCPCGPGPGAVAGAIGTARQRKKKSDVKPDAVPSDEKAFVDRARGRDESRKAKIISFLQTQAAFTGLDLSGWSLKDLRAEATRVTGLGAV